MIGQAFGRHSHTGCFYFFRSGGAGITLLVATFLILAEKALVVQNGRRREVNGKSLRT